MCRPLRFLVNAKLLFAPFDGKAKSRPVGVGQLDLD